MSCGVAMSAGFNNGSLSTGTGYASVTTSVASPVKGTKAAAGLLILNGSGTFTFVLTLEVSYDGGMTWKSAGSTNTTVVGPKELSVTGIDAGLWRLKAEVTGTTVWVLFSVIMNWSCP